MSPNPKFLVACPQCGHGVSVSEAFANAAKEENERRLQEAVALAAAKAQREAAESMKLALDDLKAQLVEKTKKVSEQQKRELELLSQQRQLDEKVKTIDLQLARAQEAARREADELAAKRFQEESRVKDAQHQIQLQSLNKQVDELKRKVEQGSQQLQGEALEVCLEDALKAAFPLDSVEPVAKGVRGADVKQGVASLTGKVLGTILWEAKRTKNWSDAWLDKIKDHQREIGADHAVIVTQAMPKNVEGHQAFIDGVWVVEFKTFPILAAALHYQIRSVAQARMAAASKGTKMEVLFDYFTGVQFKQKVEAMVEVFIAGKQDLDREKRAMQKCWSAREKQMERLALTVSGLYGDIQGIVGSSLPAVDLLELESDEEEDVFSITDARI